MRVALYFQEIVVELGLPTEINDKFSKGKLGWPICGQLGWPSVHPLPKKGRFGRLPLGLCVLVGIFQGHWMRTDRSSPLPLRSAFLKYIDKERGRAQMRFRRALTQPALLGGYKGYFKIYRELG